MEISKDNNSDSSSDILRVEESWSHVNEKFIHDIRDECDKLSNLHKLASVKNKNYYVGLSIPCFIIPLILAGVNPFIGAAVYVNTIGMTSTAIISAVNSKMDFSNKQEKHSNFSKKYSDLVSEIDKILIRKKKYRQPFDVVLEHITLVKKHLDDYAPDI